MEEEQYYEYNPFCIFENTNVELRAKIYNSIRNVSEQFVILTKGISINLLLKKTSNYTIKQFNDEMNGESHVFLPFDLMDDYNFAYNKELLMNFCRSERIAGKIINIRENDKLLLFLSLEEGQEKMQLMWNNIRMEVFTDS